MEERSLLFQVAAALAALVVGPQILATAEAPVSVTADLHSLKELAVKQTAGN